jgi:CelD/BcsL family acetyltransferase involved in cellulose biosynthesis
MGSVRAELITEVPQLAPIEDRWRELAVERSNAFITPEWFHSWWEHQGQERSSPLISVVRRDEEIVGVMPLVIDRSSRPQAIRFAGASLGDRFHPAARREDEAEVVEAAIGAVKEAGLGRHMVMLERADSAAKWWRRPHDANPRRWKLVELQQTSVAYIDLRRLDWDGYLATRSQKFRKQVRRADRTLLDEHSMVFRQADPATVTADFTELFRLHDLRRNGPGNSSLGAAARRSLHAFAVAACERGWLRLNTLEANGRQVASFLGWRVGGVFDSYQGGFDPKWSKLSVGFAIEAMSIREAIQEGALEYDFLLGTEDWKQRFTDLARPNQTAILLGARRPVGLLVAAEARARRVGSGLAEHPGIGKLVHSMHRVVPTARRA